MSKYTKLLENISNLNEGSGHSNNLMAYKLSIILSQVQDKSISNLKSETTTFSKYYDNSNNLAHLKYQPNNEDFMSETDIGYKNYEPNYHSDSDKIADVRNLEQIIPHIVRGVIIKGINKDDYQKSYEYDDYVTTLDFKQDNQKLTIEYQQINSTSLIIALEAVKNKDKIFQVITYSITLQELIRIKESFDNLQNIKKRNQQTTQNDYNIEI
ncbi:hypothetical protein NIES267_71370 (plasmid) [Calothrix parasitica NIES-267]|uniref:Uncharacterized protein n=1 Tax=Calothrix parasitica NIES-267 TaxID=1973488 RepID=A0A1Z4M287_9CYAN|nr:hypothetical protein NIES267_71370 [Calothrix parasitica NIES-267]